MHPVIKRFINAVIYFFKTISEVCFLIGFESLSTFSHLFKNTTGVSPTEFMSNQLARQKEIAINPLKFIPSCIANKNGWLKNSNFQEVLL
jgi:AraC-like DNA-binding protein